MPIIGAMFTPVAIRLREERVRRGWSQSRVAALTKISQADLSCIERGLRYPSPGWRLRLSLAFDLPEEILFAPAERKAVAS